MKTQRLCWKELVTPDRAVVATLVVLFLLGAIPAVHGAFQKQKTAECARKVIRAAEAFDAYASACGRYPQSQHTAVQTEEAMGQIFKTFEIDWWQGETELGGQWTWYADQRSASVVIAGTGIPERQMIQLDQLLDDGNLETGLFKRCGPRYHYIIRELLL